MSAEGSALAVRTEQTTWTPEQRAALVQIGVNDASEGDLRVFLNYAQRTQLDPFSRQLFMVARWDAKTRGKRWTIQVSIDGARIIAQRSGDYAGQVGPEWCGEDGVWRDVWLSTQPPVAARVGVLRNGFQQPLYAVALFREYAALTKDGGLTPMWADKPALMIAKCAEALALRKAFPHDLSGLYTSDEMARAESTKAPQPDSVTVRRASVTSREPVPVPASAVDSTPPAGSDAAASGQDGDGGAGSRPAPSPSPVDDAMIVDPLTGEIATAPTDSGPSEPWPARDDPASAPSDADPAERLRRAMFAMFRDLVVRGLMPDTREHRLALTAYAIGRDVDSSSDLSDRDVHTVLGVLDRIGSGSLVGRWQILSNGTPLYMGL